MKRVMSVSSERCLRFSVMRARAGLTLIEILTAITVSVLVLTAALAVFRVISDSLRKRQASHRDAAVLALEQVSRDLRCCAQSPSTNVPAFLLECSRPDTNTPGLSTLMMSVGSIPGPEDDFSRLEVRKVRYSVIRSEGDAEGVLMRETMTLWGPEALALAVSNALVGTISAFDVEVLTGSSWTNGWQSTPGSLMPQAARVRLDWRAGTTTETATVEVFIPAGNVVR